MHRDAAAADAARGLQPAASIGDRHAGTDGPLLPIERRRIRRNRRPRTFDGDGYA